MGNFLYAVGGYDGREQLNSVERYNIQDDTWQSVARMHHRRSALSVTVHSGMIFALGEFIHSTDKTHFSFHLRFKCD